MLWKKMLMKMLWKQLTSHLSTLSQHPNCLLLCLLIFSYIWANSKIFENWPFSEQYSALILNKSHFYMSASFHFIFQSYWGNFQNFENSPILPNIALWYSKSHLPICLQHCLSFISHTEAISKIFENSPHICQI